MKLRQTGVLAVMLGLLLGPSACTTVLIPPARDCLNDPAAVYILDHGRTSSLVLPDEQGSGMTRYAYGDWNWYALGNEGPLEALAALFIPTRGTVGRKQLPGPATAAEIREQVWVPLDEIHELTVEREAIRRLRAKLERIFEQNHRSLIVNEPSELEFVHHPRPYCALSNSNHVLADWLGEMGVQVRGPALFAEWAIRGRPSCSELSLIRDQRRSRHLRGLGDARHVQESRRDIR